MTPLHRVSGFAGLLPFFTLAILSVADYASASGWLLSYAALIFSFLGGNLWQVTLNHSVPVHMIILSLGAMLWGWLWLIVPWDHWSLVASLSFMGLYQYEKRFVSMLYKARFLALRGMLSTGAATAMALHYFLA